MSNDFLGDFGPDAFAAFLDGGIGDRASFQPVGRAAVANCTILLNRDMTQYGFESNVASADVMLHALPREVGVPCHGDVFELADGARFRVDAVLKSDECSVEMVVVEVPA